MRSLAWALLLCTAFASTAGKPQGRVIEVSTAEELMAALREPLENVTVELAPGTYQVASTNEADSALGMNQVTVGLRVSGRRVKVTGSGAEHTRIVTRAYRGLYFKDCVDCGVEDVTVVNGVPDSDSPVSGAAVTVVNSTVRISNCVIHDSWNPGGIGRAGVVAGRQTLLVVESCEVTGAAEIGISVCDDAHAIIKNNLVDGTGYGGTSVKVGCGAQAIIERNHFRNHATGVIVHDGANAEIRFNIVERMRNLGIGYADEKDKAPRAVIASNAVFECDAGGIGVVAYSPVASHGHARVTDNLIVSTGRRDPARCRGALSVGNQPEDLVIRGNIFFDNVPGLDKVDRNMPREKFWRARKKWTRTYRNTPVGVDGRHKFHESAFLTRYGRWMD